MPQMSPLSWLVLFFIFTGTMTMMVMLNFSIYSKIPSKNIHINKLMNNHWKW